jgi:hypothetical protein
MSRIGSFFKKCGARVVAGLRAVRAVILAIPAATRTCGAWVVTGLRAIGAVVLGALAAIKKAVKTCGGWVAAGARAFHRHRKTVAEHVDIFGKLVTALAILVGGIWAYRNFNLERTDVPNPQLLVDPQILPYTNEKVLLVVNVTAKNVGKRVVRVNENGCTVSLALIPHDEPLHTRLKFAEDKAVVKDVNILDEYYVNEEWRYEIEPGAEYHEVYRGVMPRGAYAHVKVSLHFGPLSRDDAITEYRIVQLAESKGK